MQLRYRYKVVGRKARHGYARHAGPGAMDDSRDAGELPRSDAFDGERKARVAVQM